MKNNNILLRAIQDDNVISAKAVIIGAFHKDRHEDQYSSIEWATYANNEFSKKGINFFTVDDDKTEFSEDSANWDMELWKTLRVEFEYNFSETKLSHIIQLMKHLRKIGHPDFQVKTTPAKTNPEQSKQGVGLKKNQLKVGVVAGAALGALLGAVIGRPIIGGMVGAAIGGGIGHSVNDSKDK
jgi:hypothetical protein